jgi:iron complex outermembrane receptor protein
MRRDIIIAASALILALSTGAAVAQEPGSKEEGAVAGKTAVPRSAGIEEIVVTSRRREEALQEVPISIVAFTAAEIANNRMENMRTLADMVPNLEVRQVYVNSMPAIYMRGVGSNDYNPSAASSVGLYVDGVYRSLLAGALFQTFDTERVEVLRGPQGTLYGKNTTGGSLNFHSVMPGDEFGGHFKAGIGNYDSLEFEGAVDIPLAEDLSSRFSFMSRNSDGYVDNHGSGADAFLGEDNWAARALFQYTPGDDVRVLLKLHGGELNTDFAFPSRGLFDPATVDGRTFYAEPCKDDVLSFRCADFSGYVARGLYDVEVNGPGYEDVVMWGSSAQVDWDVKTRAGAVTLTSITAYDTVERQTFNDSEAGPYVLADGIGEDHSYQVSQEFRAAGGSGPVVWVVGAYGFLSVVDALSTFQFPPDGGLGGDYGFWTSNASEDRIETNNYAFFGESTYSVTERARITAGLRYNWEEKESRQSEYRFIEYLGSPGTPQGTPCGPDASQFDPANCPPGRRESESWSDWSGNLTFDYDVAEDVLLFASYKRGFKSGGFSAPLTTCEFTCLGGYAPGPPWDGTRGDGTMLDTTFDPEILDAYEIGM